MLLEEGSSGKSINQIDTFISAENFDGILRIIHDITLLPVRRERQSYLEDYANRLIIAAFERENPNFFVDGIERHLKNNGEIALLCVEKHIKTKDLRWLTIAERLLDCIEKKSERSEYVSQISERFIDEGITQKDADSIRQGIAFIDKIDFKKNRSTAIIRIIPKLTEYARENENLVFLEIGSDLLESVHEASMQSALQIRIIQALTSIGITTNHSGHLNEAFKRAGRIPQISIREEAFLTIFRLLADLHQETLLHDINGFVKRYLDGCEENCRKEYISAYTTILISRGREGIYTQRDISTLFTIAPDCREDVVNIILKEAEKNPAHSILGPLISEINIRGIYLQDIQIRKLLQLTIVSDDVTLNLNNNLIEIYQIIRERRSAYKNNPILLQFIELLSEAGYADEAYTLFSRVIATEENRRARILQTAINLLEKSLDTGDLSLFQKHLLGTLSGEDEFLNELIINSQRAFIQGRPYSKFEESKPILLELVSFHSKPDDALSTLLNDLIDSNLAIQHHISSIIEIAEWIHDHTLKDYALSQILIEIADRGVIEQNRDIIQQAVSLSSMIEGEKARSDALVHIIDAVASLATRDGDLDLLIRISSWCLDLLSEGFRDLSIQTIIEAMVRFSTKRSSMEALSVAYELTQKTADVSLRRQLRESIICAYVTVGCDRFESPTLMKRSDTLEWALEPISRAGILIRDGIGRQEKAHTVAISVDTILEYGKLPDPTPYIIPITILLLEDQDPINQRAIILRTATRLRTLSNQIDLNNPYETIVSIIESLPVARESKTVLGLIRRIIDQISDQSIRFMKLCNNARDYLTIGDPDSALAILDEIRLTIGGLKAEEANEILTETAVLYTKINSLASRECILEAFSRFNELPTELSDHAGRQLVTALVAYIMTSGETADLPNPYTILEKIESPIEYVHTTIPVLKITHDHEERRVLIQKAYDKIVGLTIPYDRATLLIDFAFSPEVTIPWREKEACIRSAIEASEKIQVPFIICTIKKRIISHLLNDYTAHQEKHIGEMVIELLESITDETVRISISEELGLMVILGESDERHQAPRTILERCMNESGKFADFTQIERALQAIPDRGVRSQYYLGIAMLLLRRSQSRRVERLIQQAIREASVIRPLPRRAYILSDLALTCFVNGEYEHAGNIFDMAMKTATNITMAEVRDEVFDELDVAMQLIQEMDESNSLRPKSDQ